MVTQCVYLQLLSWFLSGIYAMPSAPIFLFPLSGPLLQEMAQALCASLPPQRGWDWAGDRQSSCAPAPWVMFTPCCVCSIMLCVYVYSMCMFVYRSVLCAFVCVCVCAPFLCGLCTSNCLSWESRAPVRVTKETSVPGLSPLSLLSWQGYSSPAVSLASHHSPLPLSPTHHSWTLPYGKIPAPASPGPSPNPLL